jgi:predicted nucleotide-binding protein
MEAVEPHDELLQIANRLADLAQKGMAADVTRSLERMEDAAKRIGKAWSGSCLGYHARVYYRNLELPPAWAHFSPEWGLKEAWPIEDTTGDWVEYRNDDIEGAIRSLAGNPDLKPAQDLAASAEELFRSAKADLLSILTTSLSCRPDGFLTSLRDQIDQTSFPSVLEVVRQHLPSGPTWSRDSLAVTQGCQIPPHFSLMADVITLRQSPVACDRLAQMARKAGSHLARIERRSKRTQEIGTNVFIGHGHSPVWRELKDFVNDRRHLPWDEFNRVPVAGVTNVARLSEMLDAAAVAFIIMTGEDEQVDGTLHARLNVVHEAGLFQGRLGLTQAIILLEDGCGEFTNITGLGQIRFPKGDMKSAFEEVRRVLEREGLIETRPPLDSQAKDRQAGEA